MNKGGSLPDWGEYKVHVRFFYARSVVGEPHAMIPISGRLRDQPEVSRWLIDTVVQVMEQAGTEHHGCQSMPSHDPEDYALWDVDDECVVHTLADRHQIRLHLLYVGEVGDFQREQALRLGGKKALEQAIRETMRGRTLVAREEHDHWVLTQGVH